MAQSGVQMVRTTSEWVCSQSRHVRISDAHIEDAAEVMAKTPPPQWSAEGDVHFHGGERDLVQYLFVLDAMNFCFWPQPDLEYGPLASALAAAFRADKTLLSATRLASMTGETLRAAMRIDVPELPERVRLLNEVGAVLTASFQGEALEMVRRANGSAVALVDLITAHFPGFRDACIYAGRQVFFYKRAQIFVADVWGALQGQGLGAFHDLDQLTMFADYRVPQLLVHLGILQYAPDLQRRIAEGVEIPAGSADEVEIRAATVVAVERLRAALARRDARWYSVQVDWHLWQRGEADRLTLPPHHRTRTIFY